MQPNVATALAHSNIALAKYWGKLETGTNLPAVPSLSLTLQGLATTTTVQFDRQLDADEVQLDGVPVDGRARERVVSMLDRVRALAGGSLKARVRSQNDFPTAAGLASSASGFAALALAASRAAGLECSPEELSALARASSASAARSLFGGFVALGAGAPSAEPVAPADHWPLVMLVALTSTGPKPVGSSDGMRLTARTSPYYRAWCEVAPELFEQVRRAVLDRSWDELGPAMEQSALLMHASMLGARPALMYWLPATVALMEAVRGFRAAGLPAYFTIDAGPHVKVLTDEASSSSLAQALAAVPGVRRVIACRPGPGAQLAEHPA
jgi:diphosphomevalonate decarboxylase